MRIRFATPAYTDFSFPEIRFLMDAFARSAGGLASSSPVAAATRLASAALRVTGPADADQAR